MISTLFMIAFMRSWRDKKEHKSASAAMYPMGFVDSRFKVIAAGLARPRFVDTRQGVGYDQIERPIPLRATQRPMMSRKKSRTPALPKSSAFPARLFWQASILFFLSGATGLAYQVIWFKR